MELIKAPLAVMVPERIDLLKVEIEQMSVRYVAIKSSEIKVFASPDMISVKQILKPFFVLKTSKNAMKPILPIFFGGFPHHIVLFS